jgi:hypothetical protein
MPAPGRLTDQALRRRWESAQRLDRSRRTSVAELVRHLGGVQAQVLSAAALGLNARTDGLTAESVDEARLRDRSVVHAWAMRGTLHLVAAEDHGWLVPLLTEPRIGNAMRRLGQEGVAEAEVAQGVRLIRELLEAEGPLTRAELAERLRRRDVAAPGQAMAHLAWLAAADGTVCHGPERDGERCFTLTRDWLGPAAGREREAALRELALGYLRSHGPARPEDLAFWSGLRQGEARRAWRLMAAAIEEVATDRGLMWDLLSPAAPAPQGLVRLLPAFDEYLLGWRDRSIVAGPERWSAVNRGGGWLHPVVLVDGEVMGTWRAPRSTGRARFEMSLSGVEAPDIGDEMGRIGTFLGASEVFDAQADADPDQDAPGHAVQGPLDPRASEEGAGPAREEGIGGQPRQGHDHEYRAQHRGVARHRRAVHELRDQAGEEDGDLGVE